MLTLNNIQSGEKIYVNVPNIFKNVQADQDTDRGVSVTPTMNADKTTTLTYTFNQHTSTSNRIQLNIEMDPAVGDWSLLPANSKYYIDVTRHDETSHAVTYTIGDAA